MKAFEIYVFREGRWKMDSIFDDRALALFDAERMESSKRFAGIRVIEEIFNEDTNETTSKTIYTSTKVDTAKPEPSAKSRSGGKSGKPAQGAGKNPKTAGDRKKKQQKKRSFGVLSATLMLCVFGGIAALFVLRILANAI